jgi:hypothetical protein
MEKDGYVGQEHFKTEDTYGVQPVVVSQETMPLFVFYLRFLRPLLVRDSPVLNLGSSPLWLNFGNVAKKAKVTKAIPRAIAKAMAKSALKANPMLGPVGRSNADDGMINRSEPNRRLSVGPLIPKFFFKKINVAVTSNMLRKIFETSAEILVRNEAISQQMREGVSLQSGHSRSTADAFYVIQQPGAGAQLSAEFMDAYHRDHQRRSNIGSSNQSKND